MQCIVRFQTALHVHYFLGPYQSSNPRSHPHLGVVNRFVLPSFVDRLFKISMSVSSSSMTLRLEMIRDSVTDLGKTGIPRLTWYEIKTVAGETECLLAMSTITESETSGEPKPSARPNHKRRTCSPCDPRGEYASSTMPSLSQ